MFIFFEHILCPKSYEIQDSHIFSKFVHDEPKSTTQKVTYCTTTHQTSKLKAGNSATQKLKKQTRQSILE